jgi:MFS family permease
MTASASPQTQKASNPLALRDFRLLWAGESVSLLGDQFALIALPWLVLQLTDDAVALGLVMALAAVPRALFMLIGGALVDRFSPRVVMFASNLARMILVALLASVILAGGIEMWMVYLFALSFGLADAFYFPGQTAIVPQILDTDQLQIGNTLIQGMAQLSMFLGPVLAGVLIAVFGSTTNADGDEIASIDGIGVAFLLDALTFLGSLVTLWLMRPRAAQEKANDENVLQSIREGIAYVANDAVLRFMFLVLVAVNFLVVGPFEVGIPVLSDLHLDHGAAAFGIIMSAFGGGALLGIILAGVLPRPRPSAFGSTLLLITGGLGIGMALLPWSHQTVIVALVSLLIGTTNGYVNISLITWLQKRVPEALMGRVVSVAMMAGFGIAPISALLAGLLLDVSLTGLFVGAGILMILVILYGMSQPIIRRMGEDVAGLDAPLSVADAIRKTGELPALRSTGEMPVVRP